MRYSLSINTDNHDLYQAIEILAKAAGAEVSMSYESLDCPKRNWALVDVEVIAENLGLVGAHAIAFIDEAKVWVAEKKIIALIKTIRKHSGLGLDQAKALVDLATDYRGA